MLISINVHEVEVSVTYDTRRKLQRVPLSQCEAISARQSSGSVTGDFSGILR